MYRAYLGVQIFGRWTSVWLWEREQEQMDLRERETHGWNEAFGSERHFCIPHLFREDKFMSAKMKNGLLLLWQTLYSYSIEMLWLRTEDARFVSLPQSDLIHITDVLRFTHELGEMFVFVLLCTWRSFLPSSISKMWYTCSSTLPINVKKTRKNSSLASLCSLAR